MLCLLLSIIFLSVFTSARNHKMQDITTPQTVDVETRAIFDPTALANQTTLIDNALENSAVPGPYSATLQYEYMLQGYSFNRQFKTIEKDT